MAKLYDSILTLPGIGPKKAELFAQLGVHTLADLLACFPRAYEDRTRLSMLYELQEETPACFEAMVISEPRTTRIRKGLEITQVRVADETGRLNLTFFNQKYTAGQLHYGESYLFYGVLDSGSRGRSMSNPAFEPVAASGETTNCILPVYSLTAGLSNKALRKAVTAALELCCRSWRSCSPKRSLRAMTSAASAMPTRPSTDPNRLKHLSAPKSALCLKSFSSSPADFRCFAAEERRHPAAPLQTATSAHFTPRSPLRSRVHSSARSMRSARTFPQARR